MAGFWEAAQNVGLTPEEIAKKKQPVQPIAATPGDIKSYVNQQVRDISGVGTDVATARFQNAEQANIRGGLRPYPNIGTAPAQTVQPLATPAQAIAPITNTASPVTPSINQVRKAAPSPVSGPNLRAPGAAERAGYVTDGRFPPKTAEDVAMDQYNATKTPAVPAITAAPSIAAVPAETVSSIYDGTTKPDGSLLAKTFTTTNNPAAGLGKFEGGDEVMLIDGQKSSFTGGRVERSYDPATGKVEVKPIGGIATRSTTLAEENAWIADIGKQRFVQEGKINADAAKDIAIGKNQTAGADMTIAEISAGLPKAKVSLLKNQAVHAGAEAFKVNAEGNQIKAGEGLKGNKDKLLQESQAVYEKAHKSYLELVKDNMDETLTPEKKLANAELYATQEARKYVQASVAMKKKKDDKSVVK